MDKKRKPTHPGAFLARNVLARLNLSVTDAAKLLGVTRKTLSEFVNENSRCSLAMAKRLSIATDTSVRYWLNMQFALDEWEACTLKVTGVTPFPSDDPNSEAN